MEGVCMWGGGGGRGDCWLWSGGIEGELSGWPWDQYQFFIRSNIQLL